MYLLSNNCSRPGADREEKRTGGEEGEILIGPEAGKLVGEDARQIWCLCALCKDPSHGSVI